LPGARIEFPKHDDDINRMKRVLPRLFAAFLWVRPSEGQQPDAADSTKRNTSAQNHQADTAEQQSLKAWRSEAP
jgi:hypothetical protein